MKTLAARRWELYGKLGQLTMAEKIIRNNAKPYPGFDTTEIICGLNAIRNAINADIAKLKASK